MTEKQNILITYIDGSKDLYTKTTDFGMDSEINCVYFTVNTEYKMVINLKEIRKMKVELISEDRFTDFVDKLEEAQNGK